MKVREHKGVVEYEASDGRLFAMGAAEARKEAAAHGLTLPAYLWMKALDEHINMLHDENGTKTESVVGSVVGPDRGVGDAL